MASRQRTMVPEVAALGERLGTRLRPLAVATAILLSLGLPTTYFWLEHQTLARDAQHYAQDVAMQLVSRDLDAVLRDLATNEAIARVRVLERSGAVTRAQERGGSLAWWRELGAPVARAAVPLGTDVRIVEITMSHKMLAAVSVGLFALSTIVGVGIALVMYFYPVGVVRGMEQHVDDLLARQESLLETSRLLASTLDLDELLDRLAEIARSLPGIDVVRIWLRDETTGTVLLQSQVGAERLDVDQTRQMGRGQGLTAPVLESGRPLVLRDVLSDSRLVNTEWFRAEGLASYLSVPLRIGETTLGVLACMSRTPRDWSRTEVALAETLGTLAAVAIRNARNFGELTRRGERLRRVADLARTVSSSFDLDAVLNRVTAAVLALRADTACLIRLVDDEATGYRLGAVGGIPAVGETTANDILPLLPFGQGLTHAVAQTRAPLLVLDPANDPRTLPRTRMLFGSRTYYGVPIQAGDTLLGVLNVYFAEHATPTPAEREAIDLFAGQAAIAIQNAGLFAESETRRRTAEALADVGRALAQALDPHVVGERIVDSMCSLLGARTAALYRLDPETGDLHGLAVAGTAAPALGQRVVFPHGVGVAALAVATRRPTATDDILNDPRITLTPEIRAAIERAGYAAVIVVPLIVQDRVIGALGAGDRAGRVFKADEIRLAQAFADQAALALENARLYEEATRRRHEAEELARVARSLTETLDVRHVGERIVDSVLPLFAVQASLLCRLEPDRSLRVVAGGGVAHETLPPDHIFPAGAGLMGRAVAAGAPAQSPDVLTDPDLIFPEDIRERSERAKVRAVLAVPMRAKGELIGVLAIADGVPREFSDGEVVLLETFADQAALALDNAKLYENAQHAYEELSQTQAQLLRGETLRAMGELASGVAHHLNNLLAVVLGRLQLARTKSPPATIDRHLDLAERAALDGAEVVRRMRGFSRGQPSTDLVPIDLNRIVEEVLELTRPRWLDEAQVRGVQIEARHEPGAIPPVLGEIAALREVLMNLVLNAVDAMPRGGTITVRTWATADAVQCEVADTGVGMSADVQRRALEPFFTTKGFHSTGLGLSVNYGILRRHGGDLTIESAVDQGTRVRFQLPLVALAPAAPSTTVAQPSPLRILLIDDELEVRSVVSDMLASQGHEVVPAATGAEGLAAFEHDASFDLVLTDLGMPGMTGWEVARAAKAMRPAIQVGLITGWGELPAAKAEDRASADFILAKPITVDGLSAAIARIPARALGGPRGAIRGGSASA